MSQVVAPVETAMFDAGTQTMPWLQFFVALAAAANKAGVPGPPGPSGAGADSVPVTLVWAATVTPDFTTNRNQILTPTAATTITFPLGSVAGNWFCLVIKFGATAYPITLAAGWGFDGNEIAPIINSRSTIYGFFETTTLMDIRGFTTGVTN